MREAAEDGIRLARSIHALVGHDRSRIIAHERATVAAIQLLERLPSNPVVTVAKASDLLGLTAPPARKAIALLEASACYARSLASGAVEHMPTKSTCKSWRVMRHDPLAALTPVGDPLAPLTPYKPNFHRTADG